MPIPTQTGIPRIGLAAWNAMAAFVNGLEAGISQKASAGDLAAHTGSTAAHGATSSATPSTPVRRDTGGGTNLTMLRLTGTGELGPDHAVPRAWLETFVMGVLGEARQTWDQVNAALASAPYVMTYTDAIAATARPAAAEGRNVLILGGLKTDPNPGWVLPYDRRLIVRS